MGIGNFHKAILYTFSLKKRGLMPFFSADRGILSPMSRQKEAIFVSKEANMSLKKQVTTRRWIEAFALRLKSLSKKIPSLSDACRVCTLFFSILFICISII